VLLLSSGLGGLGGLRLRLRLNLSLSLRLELAMLSYMVVWVLMVSLRPLARVLLLVSEDVLHLRQQTLRS
jgi:hypothetical protein